MENYSKVTNYNSGNSVVNSSITDAHYSNNMKLERPKVFVSEFNSSLKNNNSYSLKEVIKRGDDINADIYNRTKKEKRNNEFNFKRYFTIFGILTLLTTAISYFCRNRGK